jgi:hypothetical protein
MANMMPSVYFPYAQIDLHTRYGWFCKLEEYPIQLFPPAACFAFVCLLIIWHTRFFYLGGLGVAVFLSPIFDTIALESGESLFVVHYTGVVDVVFNYRRFRDCAGRR